MASSYTTADGQVGAGEIHRLWTTESSSSSRWSAVSCDTSTTRAEDDQTTITFERSKSTSGRQSEITGGTRSVSRGYRCPSRSSAWTIVSGRIRRVILRHRRRPCMGAGVREGRMSCLLGEYRPSYTTGSSGWLVGLGKRLSIMYIYNATVSVK